MLSNISRFLLIFDGGRQYRSKQRGLRPIQRVGGRDRVRPTRNRPNPPAHNRLWLSILGASLCGILLFGFGLVAGFAVGEFTGAVIILIGLLGVGISMVVGLGALVTDWLRERRAWTFVGALRESPRIRRRAEMFSLALAFVVMALTAISVISEGFGFPSQGLEIAVGVLMAVALGLVVYATALLVIAIVG